MRLKNFEDVQGVKDDPIMRQAVIDSLDGDEPDNFIESSAGAAVPGPPNPKTEVEEQALIEDLDRQLIDMANGNGDIAKDGELIYDATK